ncbi:MAG: hypothetical protein HDT13_10960 [Butyrivibrio sp.]|nr:hypothetical protein [Butyrivibrio sp.]
MIKRSIVSKNNRKSASVGIIGTAGKTGATHLAVMLAVFLAAVAGARVALAEMNGSGCFRQAEIILSNNFSKKYGKIKRLISIYTQSDGSEIAGIMSEGYDYVIIDFGCDFEQNRQQFLMCGVKLVVGSLSWWKIHEYVGFAARTRGEASRSRWKFLAVSPVPEGIRYLKKNFGISVGAIPCEPDPFCLGEQSMDFLQELTCGFF